MDANSLEWAVITSYDPALCAKVIREFDPKTDQKHLAKFKNILEGYFDRRRHGRSFSLDALNEGITKILAAFVDQIENMSDEEIKKDGLLYYTRILQYRDYDNQFVSFGRIHSDPDLFERFVRRLERVEGVKYSRA